MSQISRVGLGFDSENVLCDEGDIMMPKLASSASSSDAVPVSFSIATPRCSSGCPNSFVISASFVSSMLG